MNGAHLQKTARSKIFQAVSSDTNATMRKYGICQMFRPKKRKGTLKMFYDEARRRDMKAYSSYTNYLRSISPTKLFAMLITMILEVWNYLIGGGGNSIT